MRVRPPQCSSLDEIPDVPCRHGGADKWVSGPEELEIPRSVGVG